GWTVFGLTSKDRAERTSEAVAARAAPALGPAAAGAAVDQARAASPAASRQIRLAPSAPLAANDGGATIRRETRVAGAVVSRPNPMSQSISRAQGVGSRFRSPPARKTEKMK